MRRFLLLASLAFLAGCGGSSPGGTDGGGTDGGSPRAADLRITGITIRGDMPQAGAIAVRGVPDQDGVADTRYGVAFVLGGTGPTALLADDGLAWVADFPVLRQGDAQPIDAVTVSVER